MGSQSQEGSGSGHRAILDSCPSGLQPSRALVQKRVRGSGPFSELSGTGGQGQNPARVSPPLPVQTSEGET